MACDGKCICSNLLNSTLTIHIIISDESSGTIDFEDYSDDDDNVPSIFEPTGRNGRLKKRQDEHETQGSYLNFTRFAVKSI